jgi:putative transposase
MHQITEAGAYCVTAGTYLKQRFFRTRKRLDMLQELLFMYAARYGWWLQAWSIFPNHYHFVAWCEGQPDLRGFLNELHTQSSRRLNLMDGQQGRKVWHQYWDTHLTHQGSYLARLKYVMDNPVHHGVVSNAANYGWCSASWFQRSAPSAFAKAVSAIKTDKLNIGDDFPRNESGG